MEDALGVIRNFVGCPYETGIILGEGLRVKFIDAGHLLGSSSIEVNICEAGVEKTIVFSGDIGNKNQPLIKDPTYFRKADYVVMESTYGDRATERDQIMCAFWQMSFRKLLTGEVMW